MNLGTSQRSQYTSGKEVAPPVGTIAPPPKVASTCFDKSTVVPPGNLLARPLSIHRADSNISQLRRSKRPKEQVVEMALFFNFEG